MDWGLLHIVLLYIQHISAFVGVLVILTGIIIAVCRYFYYLFSKQLLDNDSAINAIRLNLGRVLILGLEFIVASDLIGTTTTPDYYSLGLLAIIVVIRTVLNFSLSREISDLTREQAVR